MVTFVSQSVFHSEIHENNIFYFSKIIFNISTSKRLKNTKKTINFKQNKFKKKITKHDFNHENKQPTC